MAGKLEGRIAGRPRKVLTRLQKQEEKIYRKLQEGKDSLQARASMAEAEAKYQALRDQLKGSGGTGASVPYIPHLDTLTTALKFLDQHGWGVRVKTALLKTGQLQDRFKQAEEVKKFIRERRMTVYLIIAKINEMSISCLLEILLQKTGGSLKTGNRAGQNLSLN
jgi:hypothetical protein